MIVLDCASPCQFAGNSEVEPQQIDNKQTPVKDTVSTEQLPEENKTKGTPVVCSACKAEMVQTHTKFKIDPVEDSSQKFVNNNSITGNNELPVIVYFCPKCRKIDLKVEEKLDKN